MGTRKMTIFAGVFLLIVGLLGLVIVSAMFVISRMIGNRHAVVIDAGSTSSKLNLYRWRDDPFRTNGEVRQINDSRVSPGISSYVGTAPFEAYKNLEGPLRQLLKDIPMTEWKKIPVYLAATAGMRLTLLEDPLGSIELFEALRRGLLTSGLEVETPNERIRMLSGSEEGLYGWVSVNNILKLISSKTQVQPYDTVGSLDLGGASTQIAFVADKTPTQLAESVYFYPLRLFGQEYSVYSHSFLCYGKNEFEKRTMGKIIINAYNPPTPTPQEIPNPCFPNGYKSTASSKIFQGPCMSGQYAKKVFKEELTAPSSVSQYAFDGTGDPDRCLDVIKSQFDSQSCTSSQCSFNSVYQPNVRGLFRAYSGFSYFMGYLFPDKKTGFTKTEVLDAVKTFCKKTWSEIAKNISPKNQPFIAKYCFDGLFVVTLLENYGFKTEDSWKTITFGSKIDDVSVSWALGYMLDQSGFLPSESPKVNLPIAAYIPLTVLFALMFLVGVIMLVITLACKRNQFK